MLNRGQASTTTTPPPPIIIIMIGTLCCDEALVLNFITLGQEALHLRAVEEVVYSCGRTQIYIYIYLVYIYDR